MTLIFFLLLIITSTLLIVYSKKNLKIDYEPTVYEEEMIKYFREVAINSEYYDNPERITKWKEPMLIHIIKDNTYKKQLALIQETIKGINELATDGFKIKFTESPKKANTFLYLCARESVAKLSPNFYKSFTDNIDIEVAGFAYTEFDWNNYRIKKAFIFIDPEEPLNIQESTILEEVTQSIGLMNDSEKYSNSIFYENQIEEDTIVMQYSKMDKDLIRFLYHPKMKSGFNAKQSERVILRILKEEAEYK